MSSLKVLFWELLQPDDIPSLVRLIVSQAHYYTVGFNILLYAKFFKIILGGGGVFDNCRPPNLIRINFISSDECLNIAVSTFYVE